MSTKLNEIDEAKMHAAFERYDRLKEFEEKLQTLIHVLAIDRLLNGPDYILASVAKSQMEIASSIVNAKR
jgi:hypothetical protein